MTTKTIHRSALTSAEDVARLALRLLKHDLQINEVSVTTEFQGNLPEVQMDGMELQQVLLNLVRNAIDAMSSSPPEARRLRLKTSFDGQSTVLMSVQRLRTWNFRRGPRAHIRSVLYDKTWWYGIGARHLFHLGRKPRGQIEVGQVGRGRLHFRACNASRRDALGRASACG